MSGIFAAFHTDGSTPPAADLSGVCSALAERGSKECRTWLEGPVWMAHSLLETGRASTPQQPLSGSKACVVSHARIDDRKTLRGRLGQSDDPGGASPTDAELLLGAYGAWGPACVEKLLGDFAFVIWDEVNRRLFAATDRFGLHPLYWAKMSSAVLVSNSVNALLAYPGMDRAYDTGSLLDHLVAGYPLDPEATYYASVRRLREAHVLSVERGEVRTRRYWKLGPPTDLKIATEGECVEEFRRLFELAVAERLDEKRTAVAFSGGLDSTGVVAAARNVLGGSLLGRVQGFTYVFDGIFSDPEGHYARLAAAALGLPLTLIPMRDAKAFDDWENAFGRIANPPSETFQSARLQTMFVLTDFSPVILGGDGGDEVLFHTTGYFRRSRLGTAGLVRETARHIRRTGRIPPLGIRTALRSIGPKPGPPRIPDWISPEAERTWRLRERLEEREAARVRPGDHPTRPDAYRRLFADYFSRGVSSWDPDVYGARCVVRSPFLDLRLVEFLFSLPPVPWFEDKHLLRRALRGILPEKVRRRGKSPLAGHPDVTFCAREGRLDAGAFPLSEGLKPLLRYTPVRCLDGSRGIGEFYEGLQMVLLNLWLLSRRAC